jgi:hypothetical protein
MGLQRYGPGENTFLSLSAAWVFIMLCLEEDPVYDPSCSAPPTFVMHAVRTLEAIHRVHQHRFFCHVYVYHAQLSHAFVHMKELKYVYLPAGYVS